MLTFFQWFILILTALCIGMSKTGIQGITLLVVPYMAIAFGAKESTGVILPMLCAADIIAVLYYKRIADLKSVLRLIPTSVVGLLLALLVDKFIEADKFRILMASALLLVLVVMLLSEVLKKENPWMHKWWYSSIFGLLGGFTTMIGNAAGPVMAVYLLSMRKDKREFIGINAWFFLVINLIKVPFQIFVWKNINLDTLMLNLYMLPLIIVGAFIGIYLIKLFPEKAFRLFIQVVTIISVLIMFL